MTRTAEESPDALGDDEQVWGRVATVGSRPWWKEFSDGDHF